MRSQRRVRIALIATGAAAVGLIGSVAIAANTPGGSPTPANKAVAAGQAVTELGGDQDEVLLSATMRTSKPTDLLMQVSMECSILTRLKTGDNSTGDPATDSATTEGKVRAYLVIDDDDIPFSDETAGETGAPERIVPIMSNSQPPQDGSTPPPATDFTGENSKVTFCNREYSRTVTDNEDDGLDEEDDYIRTKTANAFNWVLLNAGSGVRHIRLMGEFTPGDHERGFCQAAANAALNECSEAYVGNRTLIIEPTKMANDAQVINSGS